VHPKASTPFPRISNCPNTDSVVTAAGYYGSRTSRYKPRIFLSFGQMKINDTLILSAGTPQRATGRP
ncbi:hypothetical protein CDAR_87181, partial [Caerostris darwini]